MHVPTSSETIRIVQPGTFTTVQDLGRYGYQRYGVPVSGAMDEFALRAANALLGNPENAAVLETTLSGPYIKFLKNTWIVITGADLSPSINGDPIPRWETLEVTNGSELRFGERRDGLRSYLAIAGGIDVPVIMGSRSTYMKASIGGLAGRTLLASDVLSTSSESAKVTKLGLPTGYRSPVYGGRHTIRVILGPQQDLFDEHGITTLLGSRYTISENSDRIGYRLEGPKISHFKNADIVSDGNPHGAIQVSGDGNPTILLSDRGTTGGYAKIATVISVDLGKLAQALPGQSIGFESVTLEHAHDILREQKAAINAISAQRSTPVRVVVNGAPVEVHGENGEVVATNSISEGSHVERRKARATVGNEIFDFNVDVQNPT